MLLRVLIVKRICLTWSFNCKTNLLDLDLLALDLTEPWISLNLGTNFYCILTFRCSFFCPVFSTVRRLKECLHVRIIITVQELSSCHLDGMVLPAAIQGIIEAAGIRTPTSNHRVRLATIVVSTDIMRIFARRHKF